MKKTLVLATMLLLVVSAFAQNATKLEKIDQLFNLIDYTKEIKQSMATFNEKIGQQMQFPAEVSDEQKGQLTAMVNKLADKMPQAIESVQKAMVPIYDNAFDEKDIDNLLAFYQSPTGAKMLRNNDNIAMDMTLLLRRINPAGNNPQAEQATDTQPKSSKVKKIEEFLSYFYSEEALNPIIQGVQTQFVVSTEDLAKMEQTINAVKGTMLKEAVKIYDQKFSENEIDDLLAFYKTKTGKKVLAKSPEIASKMTMAITQNLLPILRESLIQIYQK